MATPTFVQGNTAPDLNAVLKADGSPLDLTGCSVKFQMRKADDRRFTISSAATITDAAAGEVRYIWGPNDLAVPGTYQVQWEVTYADARKQTTHPANDLLIRRE